MDKPVENDEPLYVQYMQQMHENFSENKRNPVKNQYNERKPPLSFRYGSYFMGRSKDPVLNGRLSVAMLSIVGFIALLYLTWILTGSSTFTLVYGILLTINPVFVLYDKFVMQEAVVYSLGYIYLLIAYQGISAFLQKDHPKAFRRGIGLFASIIALFLAKQTGEVFVLSIVPLAAFLIYQHFECTRFGELFQKKIGVAVVQLVVVLGVIFALARTAYVGMYPDGVYAIRAINDATYNHTFSTAELKALPFAQWGSNVIDSFRIIQDGWGWYFVILASILLIGAVVASIRKKKVMMPIFFLLSTVFLAAPYILIIKNFWQNAVKFLTNTNFFWLLIVARAAVTMWETYKDRFGSWIQKRSEQKVLLVLVLILGLTHLINIGYYTVIPYNFNKVIFEFPLSKISVCNATNSCGRDSYINLDQGLEYFVQEQKKGEKGVLFVDPQRGHPGTYFQVYQSYFPDIHIVGALAPQVIEQLPSIQQQVKQQYPAARVYFAFDGLRDRGRPAGNEHRSSVFAASPNCANKVTIDKHSTLTNLTICKFE